jgi:hypothetical protein
MQDMKGACIILVEKPEGNRSFERNKRRCDDNIKMDFKETERDSPDWIHLSLLWV